VPWQYFICKFRKLANFAIFLYEIYFSTKKAKKINKGHYATVHTSNARGAVIVKTPSRNSITSSIRALYSLFLAIIICKYDNA